MGRHDIANCEWVVKLLWRISEKSNDREAFQKALKEDPFTAELIPIADAPAPKPSPAAKKGK